MSYRQQIERCNRYSLDGLIPFKIAGQKFGYVREEFCSRLRERSNIFSDDTSELVLSETLSTAETRTAALADVLEDYRRDGLIKNWNNELFAVKNDFADPAVMSIQRAAVSHFGLRAYGVHVNGLVKTSAGEQLWVATRASDKPTFPGMLDHIVAGGQPAGLGLEENLIKEANEEASIPVSIASRAKLQGKVTYCTHSQYGLKPDTLYCFDLELPEDFVPQSNDGEVESFELIPLTDVAEIVRTTERFKPNCNLVIIDLLIRKGLIQQDSEELAKSLRQPLP